MAPAATVYDATALESVAAQTEFELRRAPERLARWRLATLDWLLRQLEELRLSGDGLFPTELRTLIVSFAAAHDPVLLEELADTSASRLNQVHDAVFDAQGRVMSELSELRHTPSWRDVERLLSEATHEDQGVAA
ncbi:MAG TPA: hypothetical protein VEQ12_12720 [Candidatus Limnocylindria bacterium]|nr:hypothetical protein [Candidatus Limnocylindria bacterium]